MDWRDEAEMDRNKEAIKRRTTGCNPRSDAGQIIIFTRLQYFSE